MKATGRLALVAACAACAAPRPPASAPAGIDPAVWIEQTLAGLTLEQRAGQLLVQRVEGDFDAEDGADFQDALSLVRDVGLGGIMLGLGTPTESAVKLNALQAASSVPLLVAADMEWGAAMRLWTPVFLPYGIEGGGATAFPFAMGVAATGEPAFADTVGFVTAREARAVGVHWLFAPVTDLNTAPDNPVINIRSFGSDPTEAGAFAAAFVRGAARGGALTTAKHYPGHGDTRVDSHVGLARVDADRSTLDVRELVPIRAAVLAGVNAVMLGHLAAPALTGDSILPASLSSHAVRTLREDLGFAGVVVTDALGMGALRNLPGMDDGELAVRAIEAGADVLLSLPDPRRGQRALVAAVQAGRITPRRLEQSVRRVLTAKAAVGLHRGNRVSVEDVANVVGARAHVDAAARIAERSIVLARDRGVLPLDPRTVNRIAVIAFSAPGDLTAGRALAARLTEIYGAATTFTRLDETQDPALHDEALRQAQDAEAVVFANYLMPISGQGFLQVPERAAALAARIAETGRPLINVSFGDPYGPARLPGDAYLLAWQPRSAAAQHAAAHAIAGIAPITGRLPVSVNGVARGGGLERAAIDYTLGLGDPAREGMDPVSLARIDGIIRAAIVRGATPGAALAVGRKGRLVKLEGYGTLDWRSGFADVSGDAIYDLASLTKVVGTTTAAMILVDRGRLDLDQSVAHYLPQFGTAPDKMHVTVRNLLLHDAGLPAWAPLSRDATGRAEFLRRIAAMSLQTPPGEVTLYSDLGFILLGFIIEKITGEPLDAFLQANVWAPLGMNDTGFNPLVSMTTAEYDAAQLLGRIAPTEASRSQPSGFIHGRVHDENAFAAGGVAGHAGLFSSARDLAVFSQMLLDHGFYGGQRIVDPQTVQQFTARQSGRSSRALGWDTPGERSSAGEYFSPASFGHTGFTGTSIWIDPERDLFVVLLTNRVNPTRENDGHIALRRAVGDAVQRAILDMPLTPRTAR